MQALGWEGFQQALLNYAGSDAHRPYPLRAPIIIVILYINHRAHRSTLVASRARAWRLALADFPGA